MLKDSANDTLKLINEIRSTNFSNFYKDFKFPQSSLLEVKPIIDNFVGKLRIVEEQVNYPSIQFIKKTNTILARIVQLFRNVKGYDDQTFISNRSAIIREINKLIDEFNDVYFQYQIADLHNKLNESKSREDEILSESKLKLDKAQFDFQAKIDEIRGQKERMENEYNEFNSKFKNVFDKANLVDQNVPLAEGIKKLNISRNFVIGLIIVNFVLLLGTIIFLFKNFCFEFDCISMCKIKKYSELNTEMCNCFDKTILYYELGKAMIFRVLIVSILLYILSFLVGLFKSISHNIEIRTHKQNALNAALSLSAKANGDAQNEILLIAANNVFSHQKTGYLRREDSLNPISNILHKTKDKS